MNPPFVQLLREKPGFDAKEGKGEPRKKIAASLGASTAKVLLVNDAGGRKEKLKPICRRRLQIFKSFKKASKRLLSVGRNGET